MTREEEITKEAKKFAKEIDDWEIAEDLQDAFEQGALWADEHPRWISVEDELPPKNSEYEYLSNNVLVTDGKEIYESVYNHDCEGWFTHGMWRLDNITHWMPLPSIEHFRETTKMIEKGGEE